MVAPLKIEILKEGQRYYHQPVYSHMRVRPELASIISHEVSQMFGRQPIQDLYEITDHEIVRLNWIKS